MKKILLFTILIISGCSTSYGEYSHPNYENESEQIGVRVEVKIKDNIIKSIKVDEDTNYFYNVHGVWSAKKIVLSKKMDYINSFIGKSIDEINNIQVGVNDKGEVENVDYDYIVGATQSSGRFILALQDAIKNYNN